MEYPPPTHFLWNSFFLASGTAGRETLRLSGHTQLVPEDARRIESVLADASPFGKALPTSNLHTSTGILDRAVPHRTAKTREGRGYPRGLVSAPHAGRICFADWTGRGARPRGGEGSRGADAGESGDRARGARGKEEREIVDHTTLFSV